MTINRLKLPDSFVATLQSGRLKRMTGSWQLKRNLDHYGNHLETELGEVFENEMTIANSTSSLPEHFEIDGYYGDDSARDEPGAIADITNFAQIIQFGVSGDGSPFCFDFRENTCEPSVIWWDDAYWRKVAPSFDDFLFLFQIECAVPIAEGGMDEILKKLQRRIANFDKASDMADVIAPKIFPRASAKVIEATENKLGFKLPELLAAIYLKIGNGGFGPGYGLIGLDGGAMAEGKWVDELYQSFRLSDPDDPGWSWPEKLLPICNWGCGIYACVDCNYNEAPVITFDPAAFDFNDSWVDCFRQHAPSFEAWMSSWLNGVNLWEQMYGPEEE